MVPVVWIEGGIKFLVESALKDICKGQVKNLHLYGIPTTVNATLLSQVVTKVDFCYIAAVPSSVGHLEAILGAINEGADIALKYFFVGVLQPSHRIV